MYGTTQHTIIFAMSQAKHVLPYADITHDTKFLLKLKRGIRKEIK